MMQDNGTKTEPEGVEHQELERSVVVRNSTIKRIILDYLPIESRGIVLRKFPMLQAHTDNMCFDIKKLYIDFRTKNTVHIALFENGTENIWRWKIFNDHVMKEKNGDENSRVRMETRGTALGNSIFMLNTIGERTRSIMEETKVYGSPPRIHLRRGLPTKTLKVDNIGNEISNLTNYFKLVDLKRLEELKLCEDFGDKVRDCLDFPPLKQYKLTLELRQYNFHILKNIVSNHVQIGKFRYGFTVENYVEIATFFSTTKPIGFVFEMRSDYRFDNAVMNSVLTSDEWASKLLCRKECVTVIHHGAETVIYECGPFLKLEIMKLGIASWLKEDCTPNNKCSYCSFRNPSVQVSNPDNPTEKHVANNAQGLQDDEPDIQILD